MKTLEPGCKVILFTEGAFEWEILGYFDSYEELDAWLEGNWDLDFEEYKKIHPKSDRVDWYRDNDVRIEVARKL